MKTDPNRHCNPITKTCSCDFGFFSQRGECHSYTKVDQSRIIVPLTMETSTPSPMNNTETKGSVGDQQTLDKEQLHTVLYIGLSLLFVLCIGTISAFYMKSLKERRKNKAIRGLLDIMSSDGNSLSNIGASTTSVEVSQEHLSDFPSVLSLTHSNRRQSRILLTPLDDFQQGFPSPQQSVPILPPIKGKRRDRQGEDIRFSIPRPQGNQEDFSCPSIAAISRSLADIRPTLNLRPLESVATFPKKEDTLPSYNDVFH